MRSTPEQIEEMLKPYGLSLSGLPRPSIDHYAYEDKDRKTASSLAFKWQGQSGWCENALSDFICHQCDVIELLMSALSFATKNGRKKVEVDD